MQFCPRVEAEPATLVIDAATQKPVVTFWHEHTLHPDAPVAQTFAAKKQILTATDVGQWWIDPAKFDKSGIHTAGCSIEGYDDALYAMRRVHEVREWLIGVIKGKFRVAGDGRRQKKSVATESLHVASIIMACDCPLVAFDRRTFVFDKKAELIAALVHDASEGPSASGPATMQRETASNYGKDFCVDWMLAALTCRDKLMGFVRQCIAQIERRDGDRVLRLSSQMPKALRREFVRRW